VGISENFLSDDLANNLKENLYKLNKQDLFSSRDGNSQVITYDAIRRFYIWLDKKHNNPFENAFFEQIEAFITYEPKLFHWNYGL
jgi:SM-20-related protein